MNELLSIIKDWVWIFFCIFSVLAVLKTLFLLIKKEDRPERENDFLLLFVFYIGALTSGVTWLILTQL